MGKCQSITCPFISEMFLLIGAFEWTEKHSLLGEFNLKYFCVQEDTDAKCDGSLDQKYDSLSVSRRHLRCKGEL